MCYSWGHMDYVEVTLIDVYIKWDGADLKK